MFLAWPSEGAYDSGTGGNKKTGKSGQSGPI